MPQMPVDVRTAIERLMIEYCYNVDALENMDRFLSVFTDDCVADLSAIGLPLMHGHDGLRGFFEPVFADMTHHFHFISNFREESWDGTVGTMTAYVIGMGAAKDGNTVEVQVKYRMECVQDDSGAWKCRHYTITPMMPMPGSLDEIHGDR